LRGIDLRIIPGTFLYNNVIKPQSQKMNIEQGTPILDFRFLATSKIKNLAK